MCDKNMQSNAQSVDGQRRVLRGHLPCGGKVNHNKLFLGLFKDGVVFVHGGDGSDWHDGCTVCCLLVLLVVCLGLDL